ncbi:hypothetical protein F5X68DRAFT_186361 [Plectosphaerella plurivora]|uniref:Ecp2 effector protein domain-containing protein n=1 Tax=Plectosphaerella plurivora TaxID=936078 RepID=A0A9P8VP12_9PEZI|nr:hypothetical protein F5X68DRAFT_186361 [Plectosphaerella plurivora]
MKSLALLPLLGSALGLAIDKSAGAVPNTGAPPLSFLRPADPWYFDYASPKPISPDSYTQFDNLKYTLGPDHMPLSAFNMTSEDITTPNPDFSSSQLASTLGLASDDDLFESNYVCRGEGHWASHHATFQCREWLASRTFDHWRVKNGSPIDLCTVTDADGEIIARIAAETNSKEYVNVQSAVAALAVQGIVDKCGWCTEKVCRTGGTNDLTVFFDYKVHVFAPKTYREGDD